MGANGWLMLTANLTLLASARNKHHSELRLAVFGTRKSISLVLSRLLSIGAGRTYNDPSCKERGRMSRQDKHKKPEGTYPSGFHLHHTPSTNNPIFDNNSP